MARNFMSRLRSAALPILATALLVAAPAAAEKDKMAGEAAIYVFVPASQTPRGSDGAGCGGYECRRGLKLHEAEDYKVAPGDPVPAMIDGLVTHLGVPYSGVKNRGLQLVEVTSYDGKLVCRALYVSPLVRKGQKVVAGKTVLGIAQDVRVAHPDEPAMGVHVHQDCEIAKTRVDVERDRRIKVSR